MSPRLRKVALTLHVASSVGWLGAVLTFLVLAVAAVASPVTETVRAAYLAMEIIGRGALVPLSLASLVTGVFQALGTVWGLVRHYWVLVKLLITVLATVILLMYTQTLGVLARAAGAGTPTEAAATLPSLSPVIHSAAALAVLSVAMVLSVFKPRGLTGLGRQQTRKLS